MQNEFKPYTYLIGWSILNKWYYGCQYARVKQVANPSNLWVTYFTSSKFVSEMRSKHGEPDVIQVRKTFYTSDSARRWEAKVCRRLNVREDAKWVNRHNGDGKFLCTGHTDETKKKISEVGKGRKLSDLHKRRISSAQKGKPKKGLTPEGRKRLSEACRNRPSWSKGKKVPDEVVYKNSREYEFISPAGELVKIKRLRLFCEANGLSYEGMKRTANGDHCEHKGWTANPPKQRPKAVGRPKEWLFLKDGEIVNITGLRTYCRDNSLSYKSMYLVGKGVQREYNGYTKPLDENQKLY